MRGSRQTTVCVAHDKAGDDDDDDDVVLRGALKRRSSKRYEQQATPRSDKKTLVSVATRSWNTHAHPNTLLSVLR